MTETNIKGVGSPKIKTNLELVRVNLNSDNVDLKDINQLRIQLQVDHSGIVETFQEAIKKLYNTPRFDFIDRFTFKMAKRDFWNTNRVLQQQLMRFGTENRLTFRNKPITKGFVATKTSPIAPLLSLLDSLQIESRFDSRGNLEIRNNDLELLKKSDTYINSKTALPPTVSVELNIYPSFMLYLNYNFPNLDIHDTSFYKTGHHIRRNQPSDTLCVLKKSFYINNGFFAEAVEEKLNQEFGVRRHSIKITYRLPEAVVKRYNESHAIQLKPNSENAYSFSRSMRNVAYSQINNVYNDLRFEIFQLFGKENVEICSTQCYYEYSDYDLYCQYYDKLATDIYTQCLNDLPNYCTLSDDKQHVKIQLDWNQQSIVEIVNELHQRCPYIHFEFSKNHAYKFDMCHYIQDLVSYMNGSGFDFQFDYDPVTERYSFYHEYEDAKANNDDESRVVDFCNRFDYRTDQYQISLINAGEDCVIVQFFSDESTLSVDQQIYIARHRRTVCKLGNVPIGHIENISQFPNITIKIFDGKEKYIRSLMAENACEYITF